MLVCFHCWVALSAAGTGVLFAGSWMSLLKMLNSFFLNLNFVHKSWFCIQICFVGPACMVVRPIHRYWMRQYDAQAARGYLPSIAVTRVRPITCRLPIPDTVGCSYTDTDTGLYSFFLYWKCDFVQGIGVCRLHMYAGYIRENTV